MLFAFSSLYAGGTAERSEVPEVSKEAADVSEGIVVRMEGGAIKTNVLNDLVEDYIDEYGLPDSAKENIISRAGILYQSVVLEWEKQNLSIEFHRKLTGKSLGESVDLYMEEYGLPDKTEENIISQSGMVYQEIVLNWFEYKVSIKIHRQLTGDWVLREIIKEEPEPEVETESLITTDQENLTIDKNNNE